MNDRSPFSLGQGRCFSKVLRLPDQTCHIRNAWRPCWWETRQKDVQSVRLCEGVRNSPTQLWLARTWINVYIYKSTRESIRLCTQTSVWVCQPERPERSCVATHFGKPLNFWSQKYWAELQGLAERNLITAVLCTSSLPLCYWHQRHKQN